MNKEELEKKANELSQKISKMCIDFTDETKLMITQLNFEFKESQYTIEMYALLAELGAAIAKICADYTNDTNSLIMNISLDPQVEALGDSGMSNITYNINLEYHLTPDMEGK